MLLSFTNNRRFKQLQNNLLSAVFIFRTNPITYAFIDQTFYSVYHICINNFSYKPYERPV